MSDNNLYAFIFASTLIVICIGIRAGERNKHLCQDSISPLINLVDSKIECQLGAKADIQKVDGKNILICRCSEIKK